jgi:hypothetical protein
MTLIKSHLSTLRVSLAFGGRVFPSSMAIFKNIVLSAFLVVVSITVGRSIMRWLKHVIAFLLHPVHRLLCSNDALGWVSITLDWGDGFSDFLGAFSVCDIANKRGHVLFNQLATLVI